ncbi:MAG: cation transporter [Acidobacteria bacterium]|nr:cation transporter [Acidobacteriota bacterium]
MSAVEESYRTARRVARLGIGVSAFLALSNIIVGLWAHSTSVLAMGFEFAGDVLASSIVVIGMGVAARPADDDHPYGHGRFETLSAFLVGVILAAGGVMICYQSLQAIGASHVPRVGAQLWRCWLPSFFVLSCLHGSSGSDARSGVRPWSQTPGTMPWTSCRPWRL